MKTHTKKKDNIVAVVLTFNILNSIVLCAYMSSLYNHLYVMEENIYDERVCLHALRQSVTKEIFCLLNYFYKC